MSEKASSQTPTDILYSKWVWQVLLMLMPVCGPLVHQRSGKSIVPVVISSVPHFREGWSHPDILVSLRFVRPLTLFYTRELLVKKL